jgi:FMN phosphatase YigB (HAD superfamily)
MEMSPDIAQDKKMIQAILFDSDGVLVDTEWLFFDATREAFAIDRAVISPDQWPIWYLAEGKRSREIGLLLCIPYLQIEETFKNRDRLFCAILEAGFSVFPGSGRPCSIFPSILAWRS